MMKYTFEFMFIPEMLEDGEFDNPEICAFNGIDSLEDEFENFAPEVDDPFFWEELEIVKHLSKKGSYWFFHFPEPEREPEAIYGMVVQDENKEWYYYTLEMGRDQFFFCQTKNGRHKLITSISGDCKEEMFKKMVFKHLKK